MGSGSAERAAAMLSGVFFDLDETLIDAGGCHREASRRAFGAFGMDWDEALGKPDPQCYEVAFSRLRSLRSAVKPDCLVVEDSSVGVTAARSAGLPVCLIPRYTLAESVMAEYTLGSLEKLPGLLARLREG